MAACGGNYLALSFDMASNDWRISKQFTIAVAEKMPAELYDFKATPEERTFGEQMAHIAGSLFDRFSEISGIAPVKRSTMSSWCCRN